MGPVKANTSSPATSSPPASPELSADARTSSLALSGWSVLVGGGLLLPAPGVELAPVVSIEPQLRFGAWRASLLALYSNGGSVRVVERAVTRGTLSARDGLAMPSLGYCLGTRISVCGSLLAGLRLVFAQAAGPLIFQTSARSGVAAAFVGSAALDVTLPVRAFRVALGASVLVNPAPARVTLEGIPAAIEAPLFEGVFRVSVGMGNAIP